MRKALEAVWAIPGPERINLSAEQAEILLKADVRKLVREV